MGFYFLGEASPLRPFFPLFEFVGVAGVFYDVIVLVYDLVQNAYVSNDAALLGVLTTA
jgi:hypothetical protein